MTYKVGEKVKLYFREAELGLTDHERVALDSLVKRGFQDGGEVTVRSVMGGEREEYSEDTTYLLDSNIRGVPPIYMAQKWLRGINEGVVHIKPRKVRIRKK